jgi:superfamily II RNA helicase
MFPILNIVASINELLPLSYAYTSLHFSAFHLSYNMILNQMRSEDGDPENLLRNSFFQFQADRAIPDLEVCFNF